MTEDRLVNQIMPILYGKIVCIVTEENEPSGYNEGFWGLRIEMPNGKTKIMWILQDEEGNGPGSINIQNMPEE